MTFASTNVWADDDEEDDEDDELAEEIIDESEEFEEELDELAEKLAKLIDRGRGSKLVRLADKYMEELGELLEDFAEFLAENDPEVHVSESVSFDNVVTPKGPIIDPVVLLNIFSTQEVAGRSPGAPVGILENDVCVVILPNGDQYADATGVITGSILGLSGTFTIRNAIFISGDGSTFIGVQSLVGGTGDLEGVRGFGTFGPDPATGAFLVHTVLTFDD